MKYVAMTAVALLIATAGFRLGEAHESAGTIIRAKKHKVIIASKVPASYLLVARNGEDVYDVQMVFGRKAVAQIQGAGVPDSNTTIDVYRVDALGSLLGTNFKPCKPPAEEDASEPDCTPTRGFPPVIPPRFKLLDGVPMTVLGY